MENVCPMFLLDKTIYNENCIRLSPRLVKARSTLKWIRALPISSHLTFNSLNQQPFYLKQSKFKHSLKWDYDYWASITRLLCTWSLIADFKSIVKSMIMIIQMYLRPASWYLRAHKGQFLSIGISVVELWPATLHAWIQFPANAIEF